MAQSSPNLQPVCVRSTTMKSRLIYFFKNSSLHGFKYLVSDDKRPRWKIHFARAFWTFFIVTSIFFMCVILSSSLKQFGSKTTSIAVDTSYLHWNNTFPAVSICMTKGTSTKIEEYMMNFWNATNLPPPLRPVSYFRAIQKLMFISYLQPSENVNIKKCLEFNETCGIDLEIMRRDLLPQSCKDFITKVKFLGEEIDCEEIFKLHHTETGVCFIANSLYSNGKSLTSFKRLPLHFSNHLNVQRSLEIQYIDVDVAAYKLFVHSPEELPDEKVESFALRKSEASTHILISTAEFQNLDGVEDELINERQCRFPSEYLNEFELPYSISNCNFHVRVQRELKSCGCTLPVGDVPKQYTICNITRFQCVEESFAKMRAEEGDVEDCSMPTCLSMEISFIGLFESKLDDPIGVLVVDVLNKPSMRYIRRVAVTKLDMIGE